MNQPNDIRVISIFVVINETIPEVFLEKWFIVDTLASIIINFDGNDNDDYKEIV